MPSSILYIRLSNRALKTSSTLWHRTRNMGKPRFVFQVAFAKGWAERIHLERREARSWEEISCFAPDTRRSLLFSHFPPYSRFPLTALALIDAERATVARHCKVQLVILLSVLHWSDGVLVAVT